MVWVKVAAVSDIPRRSARLVKTSKGDIAVFRTGNDEVYALRDKCPHRGGPLSAGIVHDRRVCCPLHGLNVELGSGQVVAPDEGCVNTFPVSVVNGVIHLELDDPNAAGSDNA